MINCFQTRFHEKKSKRHRNENVGMQLALKCESFSEIMVFESIYDLNLFKQFAKIVR